MNSTEPLVSALQEIADMTFDPWTNGAKAGEIARAALASRAPAQALGGDTLKIVVREAFMNGLAWMEGNRESAPKDWTGAADWFVGHWEASENNPLNYPYECSHPTCGCCDGRCDADEANDRITERLRFAALAHRATAQAPEQPVHLTEPSVERPEAVDGEPADPQVERALCAKVAEGETVHWYLEQAFPDDSEQVRQIMVREIVRVILRTTGDAA